MAFRNTFGAQSIRQKLLLGTLFLAIIPVAVTSLIVGRESLNSGRAAIEAQAREALIAQRASKAAQITDYFHSLSTQVQVLAASPDVVSTASRKFKDTRHAGTLSGGYKPGNYGAQASGSVSSESDYVSRSARLAYPVRDGIPILLEHEARTLSDEEAARPPATAA